MLEPQLPTEEGLVERALTGAEFRNMRARDQVRALLRSEEARLADNGERAAVFAQPPTDLPAVLRLADQLDGLAKDEEGERALVWRCGECMTRYAVPIHLVRPVSIRCERCGQPVELRVEKSLGEEALLDPYRANVNVCRRQLANFFRESMARGWPVLVSGLN
jgi:hypothetical protein